MIALRFISYLKMGNRQTGKKKNKKKESESYDVLYLTVPDIYPAKDIFKEFEESYPVQAKEMLDIYSGRTSISGNRDTGYIMKADRDFFNSWGEKNEVITGWIIVKCPHIPEKEKNEIAYLPQELRDFLISYGIGFDVPDIKKT